MSDDEKTPIDNLVQEAVDLFVYAPIGLFFEAPTLLPKLAEQGRVHANNARLFGQFAVRHGEAEVVQPLSNRRETHRGAEETARRVPRGPQKEFDPLGLRAPLEN